MDSQDFRAHRLISLVATFLLAGCPSTGDCPPATTGATTGSPSGVGGPLQGLPDNHCWQPAGTGGGSVFVAQPVDEAVCHLDDAGPGSGDGNPSDGGLSSPYGPTHWNVSANDDDCKYLVAWHSTDVQREAPVTFWASIQYATDGTPVTGMSASADGGTGYIYLEVAGDPDGGLNGHISPTISGAGVPIVETPEGSGVYQIGPADFFDLPGLWYIRFHVNATCDDILADSPHGHAAFYVKVP